MKNFFTLISLILISIQSFGQCDGYITAIQNNCSYYTWVNAYDLPVIEVNPLQAYLWDFGDGTTSNTTYYQAHTYENPGTYNVHLTVLLGPCAGMEFDTTIEIVACECPTAIEVTLDENAMTQCSSYNIELISSNSVFLDDYTAEWDFGDGTSETTTDNFYSLEHTYENEGIYIIQCDFSGLNCPPNTVFTDTIEVAFCESQCFPYNGLSYMQSPNDCNEVELYMDFIPQVDWYVNSEFVGNGYLITANIPEGNNELCIGLEPQIGCPLGDLYCEEIIIECEDDCPTQEDFYTGMVSNMCNYWEFEIGEYSEGVSVTWEFGDGTSEVSGHYATHLYEEDGTFNVSATYISPGCPEGTVLSYTIDVSCEVECSIYIEVMAYECATTLIAYPNAPGTFEWYIDDVYAGSEPSVTIEDEGVHYYCVVFESDECENSIGECNEVFVSCPEPCPTIYDFYAAMVSNMCNYWEFEIGEYTEGVQITWDFGDGQTAVSGNYMTHLYETNGSYIVTANYSSTNCPEGVDISYTVNVNCAEVCQLDVAIEQDDCNIVLIAITEANADFEWYIDDVYYGASNEVEFIAEGNGSHYYCVSIYSEECDNVLEYCGDFLITGCEEACPTQEDFYAGTINGICDYWEFEIGSYSEGETAVWFYGDGASDTTGHFTTHLYEDPGVYTVEVHYSSNDCTPTQVFTYEIVVDCENQCPNNDYLYGYNLGGDCMSWDFGVEGSLNADCSWFFGDGTYIEDGPIISHTYETGGFYTVSVFYNSDLCPGGVYLEMVIEVQNCAEECYIDVEYSTEDCLNYTFTANTNSTNGTVQWYFDGYYAGDGFDMDMIYTVEGSHNYCAVYESPNCMNIIEACGDFIVDFTDCSECTVVDIAIDSDVEAGGPSGVNWMIFSYDTGNVDESGDCLFDNENTYCDPSVCLPDGCYQMVLYIGYSTDWTGLTSAPYINGEELEIYNISSDCECGIITYDFSINSDCVENDECTLDVFVEEVEEGVFNFTSTAPDDVALLWTMGDGNYITQGNPTGYVYNEPGTYEVCASYQSELCTDNVVQCVTIIVEEESCTEVTITIGADVSENEIELIQFYMATEGFEYEGTVPLTSFTEEVAMTYCVPDGCYELTFVPNDGLFSLLNLSVTATINGIEIASLEGINGTEEVTLQLPVNDDCTNGLENLNEIATFTIAPNPARESITITTNDTQSVMTIYNSLGSKVMSTKLNNMSETIDISTLSVGLYQVKITNGTYQNSKKLIIQK